MVFRRRFEAQQSDSTLGVRSLIDIWDIHVQERSI